MLTGDGYLSPLFEYVELGATEPSPESQTPAKNSRGFDELLVIKQKESYGIV